MQHAILTLIRHAETTANLNRLLQGVTDSPVTVFGQAQIDALARTWSTTLDSCPCSNQKSSTPTPSLTPKLDLPPPTLIVCSPIGRARKTAEAIFRACTPSQVRDQDGFIFDDLLDQECSGAGTRLDVATQLILLGSKCLLVDPGLKEKDFGSKESTRGGVHVAGYPKASGPGESRIEFTKRAQRVGAEWLKVANHLALKSTPASHHTIPPHIVLVSHGMWINTFFQAHPPTTISHTSGQPEILPFAANTGIFSLKLQPVSVEQHAERTKALKAKSGEREYSTDLFRSNDTRHLANVKRQKGGFGRAAFDSKQRKLSSFFPSPPQQQPNIDESERDAAFNEESPTKKRKK
ncbi:uncharacterized protein MEPE_04387 [Melanopsichium pennsylvanicum]|uniref:Phosphoglycerate mutase-like protein n=2 Tax=Melanopsichium pennsylvanicum TaxID=63383 RepID=A0AAJ5C6M2_9BASI|nr:conserved hypothetical protein [Melanopsichium pennsylvanicum 4]SNX85678.1 uncharacterized protein MEPE_04387 [Melanopsichium pennsylvanicum]